MARDGSDSAWRAAEVEKKAAELLSQAALLHRELAGLGGPTARESDEVAEANERTEAVRSVLIALLSTLGPRAINRQAFQEAVRKVAAGVPDKGPQAVRHAVIFEEARRVLGVRA
ncbi:hypothetical protein [Methylobacterium sp. 285MFTsu5.1]|uniref:hypothetical protein n=1 Tax=Methylobacterium sp. 285MFTsu5.1 TaxID=1172187 RepID=UPI000361EE6C|nr:hypothetical protein [Methylobacterium sp. 285MFTsu5.1]